MCKDLSQKMKYLSQVLGYDLVAQLETDMAKPKFEALPLPLLEKIKSITRKNLYNAISDPDSYIVSDFQRDRRSKIQTIYDIIMGQFFEDCFMTLMNKVGKTSIHLNYERNSDKKSNSDEDFIVHGKLKTYMIEFKTLSFRCYKDLPIKEHNVKEKNDESLIFLMNKDSYDIFILPIHELKKKESVPYPKWNKNCILIPKNDLNTFNSFNINTPASIEEQCTIIFK